MEGDMPHMSYGKMFLLRYVKYFKNKLAKESISFPLFCELRRFYTKTGFSHV